MKILLCGQNDDITRIIRKILIRNRFTSDCFISAREASDMLMSESYDGAILDYEYFQREIPGFIKSLRDAGKNLPVMMLSKNGKLQDIIYCLDSGAHEFMTGPFAFSEVESRIKAMMRRSGEYVPETLSAGDLSLSFSLCELSSPSGAERLNNKQFQIMELFMRSPGRLISGPELMDKVWGWNSGTDLSVVWTNISSLRKILLKLQSDTKIESLRNLGYRLTETGK